MKIKFSLSVLLLFANSILFAQKNEIGIGMPTVSINGLSTLSSSALMNQLLFDNSEIYITHMHTRRASSFALPIIYYSRSFSKRVSMRTSLTFEKEKIIESQNTDCRDCGEVSKDYTGRFTQLKLNTGLNYFFTPQKKSKFYIGLDLTHSFKHIYEKGKYENWAWGYTFEDYSKNITCYYLGFNPSIGFNKRIYKSFSISYELGAEMSYSTNHALTNLVYWNPLNRLSVNYGF